jgi:DNA-binding GntR family transcriptional regulator
MGVSRTPIRESIRQLEADGLVERYASGGVRVRRFSARDIREIYDVLLPLFELSATLASRQFEPSAGARFESILQQAGATDDVPRIQALRDDFHTLILDLADNQWLTRTLSQLREYTGPYRRILLRNPVYRQQTLDELWGIYRAMSSRQPDEAGALMRAHVAAFRDKVLDVLVNEEERP